MSMMTIRELNLKTAMYDKVLLESSSFQIEYNGVCYSVCVRPKQDGLSIHVSDGGRALVVYPQAANAITIKGAEYAR
jgi:hypothetical protein